MGKATREALEREGLIRDFLGVIHMGDIAYDLDGDGGAKGDEFLNMIQDIAGNYAYMTISGNHERRGGFWHYKHRFNMPVHAANQGNNGLFYSLDIGLAHLIFYNSMLYNYEEYAEDAKLQTKWIKEDLENYNKNRDEQPWLLAFTHHPFYCSIDYQQPLGEYFLEDGQRVTHNVNCGEQADRMKNELEDIFYEGGLDVHFQAHVHYYERNLPIYKNKTVASEFDRVEQNYHYNAQAPVYITTGNAGNEDGHNSPNPVTRQLWSQVLSQEYGFGRVEVFNKTHLLWQQMAAKENKVIDQMVLVKGGGKVRYGANVK